MSRGIQVVLPTSSPSSSTSSRTRSQQRQRPSPARSSATTSRALPATTHPAVKRRQAPSSGEGERPAWLEPYGGDAIWSARMWGSVVALYGRYPRQLQNVQTGWWENASLTEQLCALATWREQIDDNAQDPREEIAFHHHLANFTDTLRQYGTDTLRQYGTDITATWKPGPPRDNWTNSPHASTGKAASDARHANAHDEPRRHEP